MGDDAICRVPFAVGTRQGNTQSLHPTISRKSLLNKHFMYWLYHCFWFRSLQVEVRLGRTPEEWPCVCHYGGKVFAFTWIFYKRLCLTAHQRWAPVTLFVRWPLDSELFWSRWWIPYNNWTASKEALPCWSWWHSLEVRTDYVRIDVLTTVCSWYIDFWKCQLFAFLHWNNSK